MTQALFVRSVVDVEELRALLDGDGGLAHVLDRSRGRNRFMPILLPKQVEERQRQARQEAAFFGEEENAEPSVSFETVVEKMAELGESRAAVFVRPRTKKLLREAVERSPGEVFLEETSAFGNEFEGWLTDAPTGSYTVVGPEPARRRNWFAEIRWSDAKRTWVVS